MEGCFKALENISQKDYFLVQTRNVLRIFLERPVNYSRTIVIDSDPLQDSKDALKTVLYNIQTT